jgi:hypothetical protein
MSCYRLPRCCRRRPPQRRRPNPPPCELITGGNISQRLNQDVRCKWLGQKGDTADFHSALFDRFISISSHEYDGFGAARVSDVPRKFKATTLAEFNIDNKADRFASYRSVKELSRRSIEFYAVASANNKRLMAWRIPRSSSTTATTLRFVAISDHGCGRGAQTPGVAGSSNVTSS